MEQIAEREESIRKYLLGELTDREQTEVQILLLTDEEYVNELTLVENELTDDFVFGTLSDRDQERVRDHFLNLPRRQEKLRFTKALEEYVSEFSVEDASKVTWERTLADAQEGRYLLSSLADENWIGLRLLSLVRSSPQDKLELIANSEADDPTISPVLIRLIECGVIEEQEELFFCTTLGFETLMKFEEAAGVSLI